MSNAASLSERNAQQIADLTQAVSTLVTQFLIPTAQQANANRETMSNVIGLLERHGEVMAGIDIKLDSAASQLQEVVAAQSAATERMSTFDERLEETRQLVAKNSSDFAQMDVRLDRMIEENEAFRESQRSQINRMVEENEAFRESQRSQIDRMVERNETFRESQRSQIDRMIEENEAFRESQRSQLAAIIGNARRIDRLEQQTS